MIPRMKMTAIRMTWNIENFMMWCLMAPDYGKYDAGSDDSGDFNNDLKDYDPGDANAGNAGIYDVDDDNEADANSEYEYVNGDADTDKSEDYAVNGDSDVDCFGADNARGQ